MSERFLQFLNNLLVVVTIAALMFFLLGERWLSACLACLTLALSLLALWTEAAVKQRRCNLILKEEKAKRKKMRGVLGSVKKLREILEGTVDA